MAADLSRVGPKVTQQDRITDNRSAILPTRRDTDAPQRRYFADIRNARRGDGAEELQRVLGQFQRGVNSFQGYAEMKADKKAKEDTAQGAIDFAAGTVDERLLETSKAYSRSVSLSRAQRGWYEGLPELDKSIREEVLNQDDADPLARIAKVDNIIEAHFASFALGEDGKLKDFGSPGANQWLAEQMGQARAKAHATAINLIEERMGEESITNAAEGMRAKIMAGEDVEWKDVMSGLLPSVDPKVARGRLLAVVQETALTLSEEGDGVRALQIVDGLLRGVRQEAAAASGPVPVDIPASEALPSMSGTPAAPAAASKTLVMPFAGFDPSTVTSKQGAARPGGRAHNGEDFPMPIGTQLFAPLDGEVIGSWRGGRGGHQIRIRLSNGDIVGMAHLSRRDVKVGDRVSAGQLIGLSGNSGKSTGPHTHMTVEVDGNKVSASDYFKGAGSASAAAPVAGPPVDRSVIDPAKPSEIAAEKGGALLTTPEGILAMTPEERLAMTQFRRTLKASVDAEARQARAEEQGTNASNYLARLHGVGVYPTPTEIQNDIRSGAVSPEQGAALLNTIEADQNQAEAEAEGVVRDTEKSEKERKEDYVEEHVAELLAPVYSGQKTPQQVRAELLALASRVPDRETRQAIISQVNGEIGAIIDLRNSSPQYRKAINNIIGWQDAYVNELRNRNLNKANRDAAARRIETYLTGYMEELTKMGSVTPENAAAFMEQAEKKADAWFDRTFPRRAAPAKK